jgi:hypothetical protein
VPGPRAVALLSDGFENREPLTTNVLTTFPAGLRVFTIALGAMADVPLLLSVATQTGGMFYASPSALELHEIYNQIRADATDDGLVLNDVVPDSTDGDARVRVAEVEPGAERLLVSVSWGGSQRKARLTVVDPSGRPVDDGDWGVETASGTEYLLVEILRPAPGPWLVMLEGIEGGCVVAAFIRSPLGLEADMRVVEGGALRLEVSGSFDGSPLSKLTGVARWTAVPTIPLGPEHPRRHALDWSDTLPRGVEFRVRAMSRPAGVWPLRLLAPDPGAQGDRKVRAALRRGGALTSGVNNVRLRIEGKLPGEAPFTRVLLRTLNVP